MYFKEPTSGFEYGFEQWKIVPGLTFDYGSKDPYVTSDKLTPMAIEELTEVSKGSRPFFAWFHYMDCHDEYKTHTRREPALREEGARPLRRGGLLHRPVGRQAD